jgi:predicted ATP-grasp superfamily ATP-dependent carboligase
MLPIHHSRKTRKPSTLTQKTWTVRSHSGGRRAEIEVLVLDGHFRQAVAALHSIARRGIGVGVVAGASEAEWAPALRSRWRRMSAVVPDFDEYADGYVDAVLELLDEYPARMILPSHDGAIQALRNRRAELERHTFFPFASETALDIAVSKARTIALAAELGIAVPRTVMVNCEGDIRAAINEFGWPVVIKPVSSWGIGTRLGPDVALDFDEARRDVEGAQAAGFQVMIQQWLPGRRDAVSVFCTSGRIWASFAQTSYREFPPLGGASILCESIPPLPDIVEPAEALVRAADLDGCSMVEFRRDGAGRPVLMEVNARLPGSAALAISAGVDFPHLLYLWATGKPLREVTGYRVGRRQRWLSGDLWYLKCVYEGAGRTDTPSLGRALATFFYDFLRRPAPLDSMDLTDIRPALAEFGHGFVQPLVGHLGGTVRGLARRISGRPRGQRQN